MKRLLATMLYLFICMLSTSANLFADVIKEPGSAPLDPSIMAQGGSSVALPGGHHSLYSNPAGFSFGDGSLSVLSSTVWLHSRPDQIFSTLSALGNTSAGSNQDLVDTLENQFVNNGFGLGGSLGISYIGDNLGLGILGTFDAFFSGDTFPLGLEGSLLVEYSFIGGYSVPLELGPVTMHLGADLRPFIRMHSLIDSTDTAKLLNTLMGIDTGGTTGSFNDSKNSLTGHGFAIDLGSIAEVGDFSFGVSVRNLGGAHMTYQRNSFGDAFSNILKLSLPAEGSDVSDSYVVPMLISAGASWHPDLGETALFFDPIVHFEYRDPFGFTDNSDIVMDSMWTRLHIGTELRFLEILKLRAGLQQGYLTLGAGLYLLAVDLNFALYTRELGLYPGDRPSSGASFELAIRF